MPVLICRTCRACGTDAHAQCPCHRRGAGRGNIVRINADLFDLVVRRYSAHHWPSMPAAVAEVVRVLRPSGTLVVIDVVAPESALLDTTLQTIDLLRDMPHVRDYCASEWRIGPAIAAGRHLPMWPEISRARCARECLCGHRPPALRRSRRPRSSGNRRRFSTIADVR